MSVYLKDGLVLLNSGLVAVDAACCCACPPSGAPTSVDIPYSIHVTGVGGHTFDLDYDQVYPISGGWFVNGDGCCEVDGDNVVSAAITAQCNGVSNTYHITTTILIKVCGGVWSISPQIVFDRSCNAFCGPISPHGVPGEWNVYSGPTGSITIPFWNSVCPSVIVNITYNIS